MSFEPEIVDQATELDVRAPDALAQRAISTTFDFTRAIFADPTILDDIPDGVMLVLIPDDDLELAAAEIEEGIAALRRGEDVYFRHLRPGDRVR